LRKFRRFDIAENKQTNQYNLKKNVNMKKILFSLTFICCVFATFAETPFAATYNLGSNSNSARTFVYNGTVYEGIALDSLAKIGVTSTSNSGNFRASNWGLAVANGSDEFTGQINLYKYISFTVRANENYLFTIDSIQFGIGRSGAGPRQWQWRSSISDFEVKLDSFRLNENLILSDSIVTTPSENSNWLNNVLILDENHKNIDIVEFRLYGFNAESANGTGGLQGNLTVYGSFSENIITGYSEKSFIENVNIYPSPAKDYINVETKEKADKIVIINLLGKKILEITPKSRNEVIYLENISRGVYFIKTTKGSEVSVSKIIVQ
jgi:hypothetical protein